VSTKISHGFDVRSATPIDSRITIKFIADMITVDDDIMPESYIAVCAEDGALYTYLKSRTSDPVTGKFRPVNPPTDVPIIYGMHVDGTKDNPAEAVTYLEGCDNEGFTPAGMDFSTGVFSYGSWENAFFMPRPCMLKYDGTVAYYLDPNDYTKKEDGTESDVSNVSFDGNAMMNVVRIMTEYGIKYCLVHQIHRSPTYMYLIGVLVLDTTHGLSTMPITT